MAQRINYIVQQIENAYNPESRNQQQALDFISNLMDDPNSIEIAENLFDFANQPYVINVAITILKKNVSHNWPAMPKDYRDSIKTFLTDRLAAYDESINNQLSMILAIAATKDFPNDWPTFFEDMYQHDPPAFEVLSNFFSLISNSDSTRINPQQSKLILDKIQANKSTIINKCLDAIPLQSAAQCLKEMTPYYKWDDLDQSKFSQIVVAENPECFSTMCAIGCIDGFPQNLVGELFLKLAELANILYENSDETVFNTILPFILKYAEILEDPAFIGIFNDILLKVAGFDLMTHLDFWETFSLSIFNTYKTTGSTDRFISHQEVLEQLTDYVIRHMPQPPGFILPGEGDTSLDEGAKMEYHQMRNIFVSTLTIEPMRVLPKIQAVFSELEAQWHPQVYCSLVWSLSCIAGATGSIVEGQFVVDSLNFILKSFKSMAEDKESQSLIAAGFLFLVSSYAKAQKLTTQFIQISIKLAISGLLSDNLRRMASLAILSIGTNCASLVQTAPQVDDLILHAVEVPPEQFTDCCEGLGRIYHNKGKLDLLVALSLQRWKEAKKLEESSDVIESTHFVMCSLLGYAKVDPAYITTILEGLQNDIQLIMNEFEDDLLKLSDLSGYPEQRTMYNFLRTVAVLYKVCGVKTCKNLFDFYHNADPGIRPIEILQLADAILKTELTDEEALEIHNLIIEPTKEMIRDDENIDPSFPALIPNVINIFLSAHFSASLQGEPCIVEQDLTFLLELIKNTNHTAILSSINAIDRTLNKADLTLTGDDRIGFFRLFFVDIVQTILFVSTEPSHRFCLDRLIQFVHKLFLYISADRIHVSLFDPPVENEEGFIGALVESLETKLPSITKQNLEIMMRALLQSENLEETQSIMVDNFISAARQTVPGEIMRDLQMKKMKSYIEQTGWADCEN